MKVEVEVTKEAYEVGQGVAAFVGAMTKALQDGWQPLGDVPTIVKAAMNELAPALKGVEALPAEVRQGPQFANALALGVTGTWQKVVENLKPAG